MCWQVLQEILITIPGLAALDGQFKVSGKAETTQTSIMLIGAKIVSFLPQLMILAELICSNTLARRSVLVTILPMDTVLM
jgi:hypothetical protein